MITLQMLQTEGILWSQCSLYKWVYFEVTWH